jgi:S1-C subfamily serine protease
MADIITPVRQLVMADSTHWAFPTELQPKSDDVGFDLTYALNAVVAMRVDVVEDAFTASVLGTERTGNGVVISEDGIVLTIGYLITEADTIWLTTNGGNAVPGHALAYDQVTGLGLVMPLGTLGVAPLPRVDLASADLDDDVYVIGHGGRAHALRAKVFSRREFAGYWEYLLDEALFTTPPHPEWSGAALLDTNDRLVGVGSLFIQEAEGDKTVKGNMFVPSELIDPILDDMLHLGRVDRPPRPWLGLYATEVEDKVVIVGLADNGPAQKSKLKTGDLVISVGGTEVSNLAGLFRRIWAQGEAGVEVPLLIYRDGKTFEVRIPSSDRTRFLKRPSMH